jgi:probable F420-dependent oxidoreductase
VGAFVPVPLGQMTAIDEQRSAVVRMEHAGYRTAWVNEPVGGKDALMQSAILLAATHRLTLATGVANVWARPALTGHGAAAMLEQAYPGRIVLGLGVGYPYQAEITGQEFGNPLATMRRYLAAMDQPSPTPAPDAVYPRIIAANGPKMLALAGEVADGAMPAGLPPEFTAQARQALGPDKLLVIGLSVQAQPDREHAKSAARELLSARVQVKSFAQRLAGLGYRTDDIAAVSDRLVDAVVGYGDPSSIAALADRHREAGADHVVLMLAGVDFGAGVEYLEKLAPAVVG